MGKWLFIASVTGALAVLLAAFGEHGLANRLSPSALNTFATGARYQMIHALAMGLAALAARGAAATMAKTAALLFLAGILLFSGSLYGLAESSAMRETRISGNALGKEYGIVNRQFLEELFGALMGVEHSKLQVQDGLARHRETEMAGLNDARMDRPHGNLENALP